MNKEQIQEMLREGIKTQQWSYGPEITEENIDRFEVQDGVVMLYAKDRLAGTMSFSAIERIHFAVQTHKKLQGYPEPVPTHP